MNKKGTFIKDKVILVRLFVTELADSKRDLERSLKPITKQIIQHLFKLYLMPDNINRNHWKREIANFLSDVPRLVGNNKFPTSKQLYVWTYNKWWDVITDTNYMKVMVQDILDEYSDINEIRKTYPQICEEFNSICETYFKWLCEKLSKNGIVARTDIYNKIDELV